MKHPNPKLQAILDSVNSYDPIYCTCLYELDRCKDRLNFTQARYALEVILGMAWLEKNVDSVCQISQEKQRNLFITNSICLMAEPGLIAGTLNAEIRKSLFLRIDEFKQAFLFDKERDQLASFFAYAFTDGSGPCFNGRLISLKNYIVSEQLRISNYAFESQTAIDPEACKLENAIYNFQDQKGRESMPSIQELKSYLLEYLDSSWRTLAEDPRFEQIYYRAIDIIDPKG